MTYPTNQIPSVNPQNFTMASPVGLQSAAREPTAQDNTFPPGYEWLDTTTGYFYKCVSSTIAGAVWTPFVPSVAGTVSALTGNSGGAVGPDDMGNINVVGDGTTVNVTGDPGDNTLTISLVGGDVATQSFVTNVSGPVYPTSDGVIDLNASTSTYTNGGVSNTIKTEVQGTNHAVFIGKGVHTPASTIAVGSNGQVIIGATGADPAFATITSSDSSITFTAGANSLDMVVSSTGAVNSVNIQVFTTSGTYTPTSGMIYCIIEAVGGGGSGGSGYISGATLGGGGGGAGGYSRLLASAATIGASQTITINGAGGSTVVGSLITCNAGSNGGNAGNNLVAAGGAGGTASGGTINITGNSGNPGTAAGTTANPLNNGGSNGGGGFFGGCGLGAVASSMGANNGGAGATNSGSGGGGGGAGSSNTGTGGSGAAGIVVVTEYVG
jgi:hypothetical protein